jgi:hypothetical protein
MKIAVIDTNLTDAQWNLIRTMLPKPSTFGRPPTDRRRVLDAILYMVKGGIPWRLLPSCFPPWKTVFHIFRHWQTTKLWEFLNDRLRAHIREAAGRKAQPTAAIIDSQSVKSAAHGGTVGYDAGKRIKGRKRHLLVDSMGLLLGVVATPASTPEREGGKALLGRVLHGFTSLRRLWADGGYAGSDFAQSARELRPKLEVEIVKRSDDTAGFKVLPKRWVVERTFGWLMQHRRLARDYERTESSAEAWVYLAMIRIQLLRLA